jgi:hypothetical protein
MSARDLIRFAERDGWSASVSRRGHIRLDHPEAAMPIFAASTPSDHRALANAIAMMRRALPPREPKPPPAVEAQAVAEEEARAEAASDRGRRGELLQRLDTDADLIRGLADGIGRGDRAVHQGGESADRGNACERASEDANAGAQQLRLPTEPLQPA